MRMMKTLISKTAFVLLILSSATVWAQEKGAVPTPPAEAPAPAAAPAIEALPTPGSRPGTIGGAVRSAGDFPGGTVTVENLKSGETKTGPVPKSGDYEIIGLSPGTYDVTIKAEGFTTGRGRTEPGAGPLDMQVRPLMAWEPMLPFFSWLFQTDLGAWVRQSTWAVAYLEVFHLLGLTVLLGSSVAMGLRLGNMAMRSLPTSEVAREIRPYMWGGLIVILLTGIPILASEAEKMFQSHPFEMKMFFFALANIFQFGLVAFLARSPNEVNPVVGKLAALVSVVLWYATAWNGRAIAFF